MADAEHRRDQDPVSVCHFARKTQDYENSSLIVVQEFVMKSLLLIWFWGVCDTLLIGDRFSPLAPKILFQEAVGEKRQWLAQGSLWRNFFKQLEGTFTEVWIFQMPPTDVFGWVHHQVKPDMTCPHVTELIALNFLAPICQVPMWTGLLWAPYGSWKPRVWKPNLFKLTSF